MIILIQSDQLLLIQDDMSLTRKVFKLLTNFNIKNLTLLILLKNIDFIASYKISDQLLNLNFIHLFFIINFYKKYKKQLIKTIQFKKYQLLQIISYLMLLLDIGITVGPLLGYISQLRLIKQKKSLGSFSIDVCAILLISNILRLYFWFTTGYAFNLFIQSILLIIIQLMLLQQCVKLNQVNKSMFDMQSFWRWEGFDQYVKFLLTFIVAVTIITIVFQIFTFGFYGQMIGYMSMSIEATLGLPQLISNYKNKSVEGLSFTMIATWFIGDFFKTLYYIMEHQPFQFIMCGAIQLAVDIMIILQIIAYSKNPQLSSTKEYESVNTETIKQ